MSILGPSSNESFPPVVNKPYLSIFFPFFFRINTCMRCCNEINLSGSHSRNDLQSETRGTSAERSRRETSPWCVDVRDCMFVVIFSAAPPLFSFDGTKTHHLLLLLIFCTLISFHVCLKACFLLSFSLYTDRTPTVRERMTVFHLYCCSGTQHAPK